MDLGSRLLGVAGESREESAAGIMYHDVWRLLTIVALPSIVLDFEHPIVVVQGVEALPQTLLHQEI